MKTHKLTDSVKSSRIIITTELLCKTFSSKSHTHRSQISLPTQNQHRKEITERVVVLMPWQCNWMTIVEKGEIVALPGIKSGIPVHICCCDLICICQVGQALRVHSNQFVFSIRINNQAKVTNKRTQTLQAKAQRIQRNWLFYAKRWNWVQFFLFWLWQKNCHSPTTWQYGNDTRNTHVHWPNSSYSTLAQPMRESHSHFK